MSSKTDKSHDDGVREAFTGLIIGVTMMIVFFLILHFVFDIKMFQ
ncbi:hypothetical protein [Alkalicoccus daliensis]|uniref:Uncharacterized protein n=1 Tax=Alkalicoccus daliensis TaxID=745820 RepID=A0A1H0GZF9_9BACI|nr:hypothetical protein [Alkalicoccus daliensis]SDO12071.1 hypothetical protein SAMN04488053_107100 [Alkalicoccus daliensis]